MSELIINWNAVAFFVVVGLFLNLTKNLVLDWHEERLARVEIREGE